MPGKVDTTKIDNNLSFIIIIIIVLHLIISVFQIINYDYAINDYYKYESSKSYKFHDSQTLKFKKTSKNMALFFKYFIIIINIISFLFGVLLSYEILKNKKLINISIPFTVFINILFVIILLLTIPINLANKDIYKEQISYKKHYNTQIMNINIITASLVLFIIMILVNAISLLMALSII